MIRIAKCYINKLRCMVDMDLAQQEGNDAGDQANQPHHYPALPQHQRVLVL